ncbi:MAG: hypothetical protein AAGE85_00580 [Pseudomonadota bacterium]
MAAAPSPAAGEPRYADYRVPSNPDDDRYVYHKLFKAAPFAVGDVSRFMFDGWQGPAIPVWVYVPSAADVTRAPILFMMHGASRNPARYLLEWAPFAEEAGIVVVAPEFSRKHFSGRRGYNRGNVSNKRGDRYTPIPEPQWSFSAIEPLFDHVVTALQSVQPGYTLYGHSAGAQFVHRFLYYKPEARAKRFIAANAGWYTTPDLAVDYPYGLRNAEVSEEAFAWALRKPLLVLLGDKDVNMSSSSLNRSEKAMQQGEHRYNRGVYFFKTAMTQAERHGLELGWRIKRVKGVGHSNSGIAKVAVEHVR